MLTMLTMIYLLVVLFEALKSFGPPLEVTQGWAEIGSAISARRLTPSTRETTNMG